ncbi:MAG: hypothetical protein SWY16_19045 [Cyanobacteriota bacterium]|nr:hypothetical protein [Cyanobacteriota bacterium]
MFDRTGDVSSIAAIGKILDQTGNVELSERLLMLPQIELIPGALSEILVSAVDTGCLTQTDRYGLMAAVLNESLNEEERRSVDRLLRSIRRGQIKTLDRL